MAATNSGFETAGATAGSAQGWTFTKTSSVVLHAPFDSAVEGIENFEDGWQLPNGLISYQQVDAAHQCGTLVGCSGGTIATTPIARQVIDGGIPGTNEETIVIADFATQAGFMIGSTPLLPGDLSWEDGDWVVRINVTTGDGKVTWEDTYVCRFDANCNSLAVVGSLLAQAISLASTGVQSMTIPGVIQAANVDDIFYIVLIFANAGGGPSALGLTPDQILDTPLLQVGFNEDSLFVLEAPNVGFALFGLAKAVEDFEDGWLNNEGLLNDFDQLTTVTALFDP